MYGAFVTLAVLTFSARPPAASPAPTPVHRRERTPRRALAAEPGQLYSLRARRRFAAYLRIRLLEMREAGLERAAGVIERRLPVDAILNPR